MIVVGLGLLAAGCASPTTVECYDDYDCSPGYRCAVAIGVCVPIGTDGGADADGAGDAPACNAVACDAGCRARGLPGGTCVGATCVCGEVVPDGGTEDAGGSLDGDTAAETDGEAAYCDPVECRASCGVFGLVGECGSDGCVCRSPGGDADADAGLRDDAVGVDDARADEAAAPDDAAGCAPGLTLCAGACVDLQTDAANCGACGRACRTDQVCSRGACACPAGYSECAGACRDLSSDPSNCGWCGNACTGGKTCRGGICLCPTGLTDCGGTCADTRSDPNNCGWCGNRCACGGCSGGVCTGAGGSASFTFPNWTDSYYIANDPYMWVVGDYYQGTRSTSLLCAQSVTFTLYAEDTYLDGDVLSLRLTINGVPVADFAFPMYAWSTSQSFSFAPVAGPTYTIRLEVTRTVAPWCGSVWLATDVSPWTLN